MASRCLRMTPQSTVRTNGKTRRANVLAVGLQTVQVCDRHILPHQLSVSVRQWAMSDPVSEGNAALRLQYPKSFMERALLIEHVKQRFLTYDDIETGIWQLDPQNVAFNDAHILLQAY